MRCCDNKNAPSGAFLDFRLGGRAAARPDPNILDVKGGAMKAFP